MFSGWLLFVRHVAHPYVSNPAKASTAMGNFFRRRRQPSLSDSEGMTLGRPKNRRSCP